MVWSESVCDVSLFLLDNRNSIVIWNIFEISLPFAIKYMYDIVLKTRLDKCLLEPEFYYEIVYKFRRIVGDTDPSERFKKIAIWYSKINLLPSFIVIRWVEPPTD